MDELSKEYLVNFFDRNLQLHGDRPEAVRWSSQGQAQHYHSLLDIGSIDGARVLDFGCGKGDLCGFFRNSGINLDYTGYDINGKLIALAQAKYPDARFRVFDIDSDEIDGVFDYIFLCGVFNLKLSGLDEIIRSVLKRLFQQCSKGLAFNALSDLNPHKDYELHYTSPCEMLSFAIKELSPYVALRHDRMAYDYTMFIYRDLKKPA